MNRIIVWLMTVLFAGLCGTAVSAEVALEPYTYTVDFENRSVSAWAAYPLWQDAAYDANFRVNTIVPGDPNLSIVQKVTPYSHVDNYAGAQKKFDIYMVPGSSITLRFYLKPHPPCEYFKVRLAAGPHGKLDYTVPAPPMNRWEKITITFEDFVRQNPSISGSDRIKINAIAVLTKVPCADPYITFYLGLDDVTVKAARAMEFQFAEPGVYKLSEYKPYIADTHYHRGDIFSLKGNWPLNADTVKLSIVSFTDRSKSFHTTSLKKSGDMWSLKPFKLSFPRGMYLTTLRAYKGKDVLSESQMSFFIAPENMKGIHPRILFDDEKKSWLSSRLKSERFKKVYKEIASRAAECRKDLPLDKIKFDFDQLQDENTILSTWGAWTSDRIGRLGETVYWNALAYSLHGNREAGEYARDVLVKMAHFPHWNYVWMLKRGRYAYYSPCRQYLKMSIAYDLTHDLMDEQDAALIRNAFMRIVIKGIFKTYVRDNMVTCNTSNWLSHITTASLICLAAMYDDGPDTAEFEPYFSGTLLKMYDYVSTGFSPEGTYGEGLGYYSFTMEGLSLCNPTIERVFNIDFSKFADNSYQGIAWSGIIADKKDFYFGDSGGHRPMANWAWLLEKKP